MDEDLELLIDDTILDNYDSLHRDIADVTRGNPSWHAILTGIAMGDRRSHSAFKRAQISQYDGDEILKELCDTDIISQELARSRSFLKKFQFQIN